MKYLVDFRLLVIHLFEILADEVDNTIDPSLNFDKIIVFNDVFER